MIKHLAKKHFNKLKNHPFALRVHKSIKSPHQLYWDHDIETYGVYLKFTVIALWIAFIWFAVFYYPTLQKSFMPQGNKLGVVNSAKADFDGFPVKTERFDINHSYGTPVYEVVIGAKTVTQFLEAKAESVIFLKNFIGVESLCNFDVTFTSKSNLRLKAEHITLQNCK